MREVTDALAAEATATGWGRLTAKAKAMPRWTDRATELAADHVAKPKTSWRARRRGRRIAAQAEELDAAKRLAFQLARAKQDGAKAKQEGQGHADWVRYIAPTAALSTAAVMQVGVMTDTFGSRLAAGMATQTGWLAAHTWVGYVAGLILGLAVAACAEGGAAHLMRLYEKHLLARDSTGFLRLGMLGYVAGSAWLIHWWLDKHQLPAEIAYALAAMTGSAIFLWSRESRWRNREAMREAGQLDVAMPRLPLAAKLMHPIRWAQTQWLISWEPVATTEDARARYADLAAKRAEAKQEKATAKQVAAIEKGLAEDKATTSGEPVDPWDQAVPAEDVDIEQDLTAWTATTGGQAVVARAKRQVATATRKATYDVDAAKQDIRRGLDEIPTDVSRAELEAAKRRIDDRTMKATGLSHRQARKLRAAVSGEPVSSPPAGDES